jgi:hypothetical protein
VVQHGKNAPVLSHHLSPVMVDIDGWHAPRDHIAPLFFNDNTNLHCLIRECLIIPYLIGSFHPEFRLSSYGSAETRS